MSAITLPELVRKIESAYGGTLGQRSNKSRAVTGESFQTFVVVAPSVDAAIRGLHAAVFAYLSFAPPEFVLYWRKKPVIEPYDEGGVQILCRLLASNKPDLSPKKVVPE